MKQAEGEFIGVELDLGAGLNDGSVMGRKYFKCTAGHGIFVRQNAVALLPAVKRSASANTGLTAQQPTASATTAAADKSEKGHESHTSAVIDARAAALGAENVPSLLST
eukprot:6212-Heterococcus_DN1.PRE.1